MCVSADTAIVSGLLCVGHSLAKMRRRTAKMVQIYLILLLFGASYGVAGEDLVYEGEGHDVLSTNCTDDTAEEFEAILCEGDGDTSNIAHVGGWKRGPVITGSSRQRNRKNDHGQGWGRYF